MSRSQGGLCAAVELVAEAGGGAAEGEVEEGNAQECGQLFDRDRAVGEAAAVVGRRWRIAAGEEGLIGGEEVAVVGEAVSVDDDRGVGAGAGDCGGR